jgi:hypothetical protein
MENDFFDDDVKFAESGTDKVSGLNDVSVVDANLDASRLMRQKKELDGRVVVAAKEIDLLKRRQNELESRKEHMEEIARKQADYEKNKRDIIVKLDKSLILLEKEELQATRLVDLVADIRSQFKIVLEEIRSIKEEKWGDLEFEEELNKAIVRVENAFMLHKKGLSKVDIISDRKKIKNAIKADYVDTDFSGKADSCHSFGYWLKAGLAFSLPVMTMMVVLFVIYLFMNNLLMGI